ncbi:hypothetical protein PPACK8108_LOCUS21567 [Phakopsora pachyrhizi]|uniref:Uncharacterized protein n=1 Tax=Phakopsora pachyrhizi TaxID=170000 RepID=A0AAV0BLL8_PHAPC|nr:hypothetical protein PPACK8108_LOCUS21567 [Phakopsora pachyrhizi]
MSAHSAAATSSRFCFPTNYSTALKVLKCSESAVGFQAVMVSNKSVLAAAWIKLLVMCNLVTFIVCVKIHKIRFEPHPDDADSSSNSQPECSRSQRATRSVQIATPAYYANIVATRAKKE